MRLFRQRYAQMDVCLRRNLETQKDRLVSSARYSPWSDSTEAHRASRGASTKTLEPHENGCSTGSPVIETVIDGTVTIVLTPARLPGHPAPLAEQSREITAK